MVKILLLELDTCVELCSKLSPVHQDAVRFVGGRGVQCDNSAVKTPKIKQFASITTCIKSRFLNSCEKRGHLFYDRAAAIR